MNSPATSYVKDDCVIDEVGRPDTRRQLKTLARRGARVGTYENHNT